MCYVYEKQNFSRLICQRFVATDSLTVYVQRCAVVITAVYTRLSMRVQTQ